MTKHQLIAADTKLMTDQFYLILSFESFFLARLPCCLLQNFVPELLQLQQTFALPLILLGNVVQTPVFTKPPPSPLCPAATSHRSPCSSGSFLPSSNGSMFPRNILSLGRRLPRRLGQARMTSFFPFLPRHILFRSQ